MSPRSVGRRRGARIALLAATAAAVASFLAAPALVFAPATAVSASAPAVQAYPGPGWKTASPVTTIVFRGASRADFHGSLQVTGSESGRHPGHVKRSRVGTGAIFVPKRPFHPGEKVTVETGPVQVQGATGSSYHFTVATPQGTPTASPDDPAGSGRHARSGAVAYGPPRSSVHACTPRAPAYHSRPDLHPVPECVSRRAVHTADGLIFATPNPTTNNQHGPTIYDNQGNVVWYHPMAYRRIYDLTVVTYHHHRMLVLHLQKARDGSTYQNGAWVFYNKHYRKVARVMAPNGYVPDGHEIQVRGDNAWIGSYYAVTDPVSHQPVFEYIVQEVNIPTGELLFEWHSLDHIPAADSYKSPVAGGPIWDYFHGNAIEPLRHGGFLVSSRNTSSVYKIAADGRVVWTMGGKADDFDLVSRHPDWQFCYQHDVRLVGPHELTVFDNGGRGPKTCPAHQARVEQFSYDTRTWTVQRTAKWSSYYASSDGRGYKVNALGSARYLTNGDMMVSWGQTGHITEFTPQHHVNFDLTLAKHTYRADRWRWVGNPLDKPAVAASRTGATVSVYASWNGSTRVGEWRVLAGPSPSALRPVGNRVQRTGFETRLSVRTKAKYVAVRARDLHGNLLTDSAAVPAS
jgi:hypothetical protein